MTQLHQRIDCETPFLKLADHCHLGLCNRFADVTPGIGKEFQRPFCGDAGIKLAKRTGRSVSRIGKLTPAVRYAGIQGTEILMRHVDLAAHLDNFRPIGPGQLLRDISHGPQIFSDSLVAPTIRRPPS